MVLALCASELSISRVSLWSLNKQKDAIYCEHLYKRLDDTYESGLVLREELYPSYFEAITKDRLIVAIDARGDPRTREFTDGYLKPLGIKSMLDAPVFSEGQLYGVLCIEQTEKLRKWDLVELSFATAVADCITVILGQESWLKAQDKLNTIEQTDNLTSLESRHFFNRRILKDLSRVLKPYSRSVVVIGLDNFSTLNEKYGPIATDSILQVLSGRFAEIAREYKIPVSRISGDVFGFWLSDIHSDNTINELVGKIHEQASRSIEISLGQSAEVRGTVGAVIYPTEDYEVSDPIHSAELTMHRAKEKERGGTLFFESNWAHEIQNRRLLEKNVCEAFEKNQFSAFYQPIVSTSSGAVTGVEALVRWHHPSKGLVSPGDFLPIISELGLMSELGELMLNYACEAMNTLIQNDLQVDWVAVNLSPEQLYNKDLIPMIERTLESHKIPSSLIHLEVVEELFSQDPDIVSSKLQAIADLGIKLSIDDFGTGYSSLSRLKYLPISKLKIDKSFVDGLPELENDECIARSILGLAKGMGMDVVAEGVESIEQVKWLHDHGCDFIQGYYFAKPMDFESLQIYLKKRKPTIIGDKGGYDISVDGNLVSLNVYGRFTVSVAKQMYVDIEGSIKDIGKSNWALLVDTTRWVTSPLEVQKILKQSALILVKKGLKRTSYILGESDLIDYQLELISPVDENYLSRRFYKDFEALEWLSGEGFSRDRGK